MAAKFSPDSALSTADFVWLLGSLCQTHRIPWDPALVQQIFPPPYSSVSLHESGKQYGFRFGETQARSPDWASATFPLIAFRAHGDSRRPVRMAKARGGRVS